MVRADRVVVSAMRHTTSAGRILMAVGALAGLLVLWPEGGTAATRGPAGLSDQECLRCHGDPALTRAQPGERGRTMYVDPAVLAGSRHGKVACTGCHTGVTRLPHEGKPGRASCSA